MQARLQLRFQHAAPRLLVERALSVGFLPDRPPSEVRVDYAPASIQAVPALLETTENLSVTWEKDAWLEWSRRHDDLHLHRSSWAILAENLLGLLRDLPFEACLTGNLIPSWWEGHK